MKHPCITAVLYLSLVVGASSTTYAQGVVIDSNKYPRLSTFTTQQDHANMMQQLGIKRLRPGPSGNESAPNHANYDESIANPCPQLPDILTTKSGSKVTNADAWWKQRRPEIAEDFEREVYGRLPKNIPKVTWTVKITDREFVGRIPVLAKQLTGHVDNSSYPLINVDINMVLVVPMNVKGPVPVLMMFGRPTLPAPAQPSPDEMEKLNKSFKEMMIKQDPSLKEIFDRYPAYSPVTRLPGPNFFAPAPTGDSPPTEQLLAAGWGYVLIDPASIQADNGAGLTRGIIGLVNKGQPRKPDDWGSLRAWAWGAARGLDYLETDSLVDAKKVGIEGVSRYGKAALVTLAFEPRFAVGLIGSSGKGGATLHRRVFGEAVESLTGSGEYHWMAGNYLKYGTEESTFGKKTGCDLPVDSHELIAMCAPRLAFISYGIPEKGDARWLDQQGSWMATVAAGAVYKLTGAKDLGISNDYMVEKMPPVLNGLLNGELAWRQHDGGHTDAPNFQFFIPWATTIVSTQSQKGQNSTSGNSNFRIIKTQQHFQNPILAGFYPDPSICRVGNDYYITVSSFGYFPGLPIFHSTDLVNWKQIGHAMDRNEQLDQSNARITRGLFAPTIRYHNGTFYIICTLIDKGGNFVITAKDPKGPWSNPVWLPQVNGIDPSIFFDDNGKAYIMYNSIPPDNKPLYDGHRTIRIVTFDEKRMEVVSDNKIIVNGGVDISKKPVWIEAPHILKKDGWYYLICAEGGTGYNHSEVVFRSKYVDSAYVPYENNPILTQRHLDPARKNPVTTAGHADFVETPDGKWYAVFLACRPYEGDHYNIGRETFMAPVEWKNGWPLINPGFEEVQYQYPVPFAATTKIENKFTGNYLFKDDFKEKRLNHRYMFLRNPEDGLYSLANGKMKLPLKPVTAAEKKNAAFIGFRQSHHKGYASTIVEFNPASENEKAGLLIFQSEKHYYFLCKSIKNNQPVVELYRSAAKDGEKEDLLASALLNKGQPLLLKIEANNDKYSFYYSEAKDKWTLLKDNVDGKFLSTKVAGGFVGSMFALYATSNGVQTRNVALFDWFEYKGDDEVFKGRK